MDSSNLVKSLTDAWDKRKVKRDRGTLIVRKLDDDKLIYEVQCSTCHGKTKINPRTELAIFMRGVILISILVT